MIKELIKLAQTFEDQGLTEYAKQIEELLKKIAEKEYEKENIDENE